MPIDSTNYGREIKNLRAEIADLRTEVAFMYSAFKNIQEQFGFALSEIANSIKTLNSEIKNFQQNNSVADSVNENFSRIENSLAAQQKIFSDIFNQQSADFEKNFNSMQEKVAGVGENISVVQKNIKKFSSEVDEILSDNQKNLLKKIDSANDKPKDFYKTLNAIEELLRLIAANQLLNEVQQNLPTKNNSLPKAPTQKQEKNSVHKQTSLTQAQKIRFNDMFKQGKSLIVLGGIENRKAAFRYFLEAAEHGHIKAMKWLADCYRYGWGTEKDSNKDKYWRDKWEHSH